MTTKGRIVVYALTFLICSLGAYNLAKDIHKPANFPVEAIPMTFYIQDVGYETTETFTKYFISYTINKSRQKPILALFTTEQEKFEFFTHLESQGDIVWLCDKQP